KPPERKPYPTITNKNSQRSISKLKRFHADEPCCCDSSCAFVERWRRRGIDAVLSRPLKVSVCGKCWKFFSLRQRAMDIWRFSHNAFTKNPRSFLGMFTTQFSQTASAR